MFQKHRSRVEIHIRVHHFHIDIQPMEFELVSTVE